MKRHLSLLAALPIALIALLARCDCASVAAKPEGAECATAQECDGTLVCDLASGTCEDGTECTVHADCGTGAYCDADGACADNESGGPCDVDANCLSPEECRDGTCFAQGSEGDGCTTTQECTLPLTCDPSTDTCTTDVGCTSNADCGAASYCGPDGLCLPSTTATICEDDSQCIAGERCVGVVCIPEECQGEAFAAENVPANLMITIDRSGSMNDDLGPDGSKWDVARDAVDTVVTTYQGQIRFGLNPYPGTNQSCSEGQDCGTGYVAIDVGPGNEGAISTFLDGADTCRFGTPTAENLQILVGHASLQDAARGNYVLLITDGQSTCGDPIPVVAQLFAQTPSVATFVIGFGDGVDPDELTAMANAGGRPRAGGQAYYQADDAASLQAALADILGSVLSCDYVVAGAGDDPDALTIYFNGQPVPRDPSGQTGWDYFPQGERLRFAGNACIALQSGVVTDLTIVFGCPIEQPPEPDAGVPLDDAGPPPVDAGPPGGCSDRCVNTCGNQACLIDPGQSTGTCGACRTDADCCPGSLCLDDGVCLPIGG
ncbi:MAG: VWA domain-containing protein [Deltaproteobacteria bacterium]|nr:VWA domain-containing protein [Deltaproteobacteria bacterium]